MSNGFGDLMYFIEFKTRRLYCMEVTAEGSVLFVHETAIWIKGIACSNDKCCTFKEDGSSYCFKSYTSCHSTNLDSLRKVSFDSCHLRISTSAQKEGNSFLNSVEAEKKKISCTQKRLRKHFRKLPHRLLTNF